MWVEETRNGKYKFSEVYIDERTQKRKKVSITLDRNTNATRKTALDILNRRINEKKMNSSSEISFKRLAELYLHENSKILKESTYKKRVTDIKRIVKIIGPEINLNRLNAVYINNIMITEAKYNIKILKVLLKWAYKNDYITSPLHEKVVNPASKISTDVINRKLYYEKEEIENILETISEKADTFNQKMTASIIEFLVLTGVRIGECLAIENSDIDNEKLNINKRVYYGNVDTPKTYASLRTIAINSRARQIISEARFLKHMNGVDSDIVFSNSKGRHMSINTIRTFLESCNINPSLHIFRHTHASLLAEQGIGLEAIQRRLGHYSDKVTKEIYVHVTKSIKEKDNRIFSNLEIL